MMDLFILAAAVVMVLLYSAHRLQKVRKKTLHLRYPIGDEYNLDYSKEYMETMHRRVEAARLKQGDAS